ncbi:22737_t:CDS:2, partial [Gigaspora rosea]
MCSYFSIQKFSQIWNLFSRESDKISSCFVIGNSIAASGFFLLIIALICP